MAKRRRMIDTSVPEHDEVLGVSRSKQRVERRDLQDRLEALGHRLAALPARAFARLELSEELETEIHTLAQLESGSALTRQRRRVAALLRDFDLDAFDARIEEAISGISQHRVHRLERLRSELLEGGDEVIKRLSDEHPDLDRQRLGQAVRAARREAGTGVPGRRFKELFQVLRDLGLGEEDAAT